MRIIKIFVSLAVLVIGSIASANPTTDPRCEGQTGAAFGLCSAAIAMGCDNAETALPGCARIAENFTRITDKAPPWNVGTCTTDSDCDDGAYCKFVDGACGGTGVCKSKPVLCAQIIDPVCGCDGGTYNNVCEMEHFGVSKSSDGACL